MWFSAHHVLIAEVLLWFAVLPAASDPAPIAVPPSGTLDGDDGPWSSFFMRVGSPAQDLKVLVSTSGAEATVILPGGCNSTDPENCPQLRGGLFNSSISSTWKEIGLRNLIDETNLGFTGNGTYGYDTVGLGAGSQSSSLPTLDRSLVAEVTTNDYYLGSLGLSNHIFNLSTPTFITSLVSQNLTPSSSYAYTAGAPYRRNGVLASLTFGGYDSSRFKPNNVTFYITNGTYQNPIVNITSITAGGVSGEEGGSEGSGEGITLYQTSFTSSIDAATGQIWLPIDACKAFERAFGLEYDPVTQLYPVNDTTHNLLSTQNTTVTFNLNAWPTGDGPVPITLPYSAFDLNATYPFVANSTRYFPLRRAANTSQYTLGRAFLQEAYLIVDHQRGTFSVSQCTFDADATQNLVAIQSVNSTNSSSSTASASATPSPSSSRHHGLSGGAIAGIVIGSIIGAVLFASALYFCLRWQRNLDRTMKQDAATVPSPVATNSEPGLPHHQSTASPPIGHHSFYDPSQKETGVGPEMGMVGASEMGRTDDRPDMARVGSPELMGDSPVTTVKKKEQRVSELKGDRRHPTELEAEEAERRRAAELPGTEGERAHELE